MNNLFLYIQYTFIQGEVQNYAWGKVGTSSSVANLYASVSGTEVDEGAPYAELWYVCTL